MAAVQTNNRRRCESPLESRGQASGSTRGSSPGNISRVKRTDDAEILAQLSSRLGTRGEEANVAVANRCLGAPGLLDAIAAHLSDRDTRLAGDCAEVMTKVAEQRPELVAPYARTLAGLLEHKNGRVRWESAHAFALVAAQVPRLVAGELERLGQLTRRDESVIVRDYLLDAIANFGATGAAAAQKALPLLRGGLIAWNGKHAARVLRGLEGLVKATPKLAGEVRALAEPFRDHARPGIRKAARSLLARVGATKD